MPKRRSNPAFDLNTFCVDDYSVDNNNNLIPQIPEVRAERYPDKEWV